MMKATITDVAKQAGVSMKTVSRVLNNEPNVAVKTREKVMAVAKELRYSPNLAARGLASSKSYLIAMMFGSSSPNYLANLQAGAIEACRENGYHLVVEAFDMTSSHISDDFERRLERLPVDGIILTAPFSDSPEIFKILKRLNIDFVPVAPSYEIEGVSCVKMDNVQAAREMTEYLIGLGHKDIGFIKGPPRHSSSGQRYKGFEQALLAHDINVNPSWLAQGDFSFKSGVDAATKILKGKRKPSAIFASNDDMAAGVVSVASRQGLSVPDQLSVTGFDDTPLARILWPQLTTIKQPIYEMGYRAAELLIIPPGSDEESKSYCMIHDLIIRDSTKPYN